MLDHPPLKQMLMILICFSGISWIPWIPRCKRREGNQSKSWVLLLNLCFFFVDFVLFSVHFKRLNLQICFSQGLGGKAGPRGQRGPTVRFHWITGSLLRFTQSVRLSVELHSHFLSLSLSPSGTQRSERTKRSHWEIRSQGLSTLSFPSVFLIFVSLWSLRSPSVCLSVRARQAAMVLMAPQGRG